MAIQLFEMQVKAGWRKNVFFTVNMQQFIFYISRDHCAPNFNLCSPFNIYKIWWTPGLCGGIYMLF